MADETAYQRQGRLQRERQEAREAAQLKLLRASNRRVRQVNAFGALCRAANRIDGYDRDDIGPSRD